MSTHRKHIGVNKTYFCTFTCHKWLPLFEHAEGYDLVYRWFDFLKKDSCYVLGYVIMPNHIHCLLHPTLDSKSLNHLVSEGKRFMAYGIVKKLTKSNKIFLLRELANGVQKNERKKKKQHQVFRLSFDAKACFNERMLLQKLNYIHQNPVKGKWRLVDDFVKYEHSSAGFYELGLPARGNLIDYREIWK